MRQYIANNFPNKKGILEIMGKDYKYMSNVLRLKKDVFLEVRLPDGKIVKMIVQSITASVLTLALMDSDVHEKSHSVKVYETGVVASSIDAEFAKSPEIWLLQFLPKSQTFDTVIRHAVECGVSHILPVMGNYSKNIGNADSRKERWQRIVKEARQQSGSPVDTKVHSCLSLDDALKLWNEAKTENSLSCLLYEKIQEKKFSVFQVKNKPKQIIIAVGAEGGVSDSEVEKLLQNDFEILHFNTNVMRVDTACLYGLAVLQHAFTEFDLWQKCE
ncbi:MAG: RNA methyltransferase [Treponema sp.]|jgi:16S rRNA (uracil1498-N3)-methyltransferase|nr:RNA methyltransferase [Treponema sp.]